MFIDRLIDHIVEKKNPTLVGLDPKLDYIPAHLKEKAFREYGPGLKAAGEAILEFNKGIINEVADLVPAVKPQLAYYEMYGLEGLRTFDETVKHAKSQGMLVIADGKRNDIGSTAEAYSSAFLGQTVLEDGNESRVFDADALTVNPYLGEDGILPFIKDCERFGKGLFILVKTSNPSSGQLQDLKTEDGRTVYEHVAAHIEEWGRTLVGKCGYSSVGAVVGATYPAQAKALRCIMKSAYFLIPGYGAQGGTAAEAVSAFDTEGLGGIINASRSIMLAYRSERWKGSFDEKSYAQAARAEVIRMRDEINAALGRS